MPILSAARKALRQNQRRRKKNRLYRVKIRRLERELRKLSGEKKNDQAKETLRRFFQALDKAAKEGVLKKNQVARKKSRLSRLL